MPEHGLFDLTLKVRGDLVVDCHHTIEDVGIVLGEAIKEAIGDKKVHKTIWGYNTAYGRGTYTYVQLIYQAVLTLYLT